jgi:16S rRNA G966 N2-methylase RsmD
MPEPKLTPAMARNIEIWPIDRLVPYDRNSRTHTDAQVSQVAASIIEFGFTNPILVDGKSGIIAGHCRLRAARLLQLLEVPVIPLDHLTEAQKRAYIIADNKLAELAGWDEELLKVELGELRAEDFNLELTGFSQEEIDELLDLGEETDNTGLTDDDAAPEVTENPVSRPGDLWILGNHRVMCGDSIVLTDVERLMAGAKADLVFTDPPYNVDYTGYTKEKLKIQSDKMWQEKKPAANRLHPTMKPVELIERALRNSSKAGDLVVDLFGGSGSTMIACEKAGRSSALMELDPKYADVIVKRWQEFAGKQAVLEETGLSFEAEAAERGRDLVAA